MNGDKLGIDETNRKGKRLKEWNRQKGRWNVNRDKPGIDEMNRQGKMMKERNRQKRR